MIPSKPGLVAALCAGLGLMPQALAQDAPADPADLVFTSDLSEVPMDRMLWHMLDPVRFWSPEAMAGMACYPLGDDGVLPLGEVSVLAVVLGAYGEFDETPRSMAVGGFGMVGCDLDASQAASRDSGVATLILDYWTDQYDEVPDRYAVRFVEGVLVP